MVDSNRFVCRMFLYTQYSSSYAQAKRKKEGKKEAKEGTDSCCYPEGERHLCDEVHWEVNPSQMIFLLCYAELYINVNEETLLIN